MYGDTVSKFSIITIIIHWFVALLMIGMVLSGLYMTNWKDYDVYALHKSFGVIVLVNCYVACYLAFL